MNKLLILYCFLFISFSGITQVSPTWEWAKEAGGNSDESAFGLDIDSQGNILMCGNFSGNISFDSISISTGLSNDADFYIAKYNPDGDIIWVNRGIGNGLDMAYDVVCDEDDNVIITGVYGMMGNESLSIDTVIFGNAGKGDMFVAKYDSTGSLLWAIKDGGNAREWGRSIDVDLQGNIYVCGNFVDGATNIDGIVVNSAGSYGFFIKKYDSSGNLLWYKLGNTPQSDLIRNLVVFPETGNLYVFGDFGHDSLCIDNVTIYNHNEGELDNFLFKLDTDGNALWGRCIGGDNTEKGNFCTIDVRENVYVTGTYKSSECFIGTDTLENLNVNQSDTYIAMYSYLGEFEWSNSISGNYSEIAYSITSDTSDYIFVTGYFNSTTLDIGGQTFTNNGSYDIFVSKYDYQGGFHWATTVGGAYSDRANVITINHDRELFIAGEFASPSVEFDTSIVYHTSDDDVFFAKLKDYCEMPDVFLGNDTLLYSYDILTIDIPGYQDYYWGNGYTGQEVSIMGSDFAPGLTPTTITVVDSSGCVSSDELIITICNYPNDFLGADTTIFDYQQITLDANVGFDNYLWSTGDIVSYLIVDGNITGTGSFAYWVNGSDVLGCDGMDTIVITVVNEISISELNGNKINIYPNPVKDYLVISYNEIYDINNVSVFDLNLKNVDIDFSYITPNQISITSPSFTDGMYLVRIITDSEIIIEKFILCK